MSSRENANSRIDCADALVNLTWVASRILPLGTPIRRRYHADITATVNRVILVGNLGRDPEVRHTNDGMPIVNLSVATSERWHDRTSGDRHERFAVDVGLRYFSARQFLMPGDGEGEAIELFRGGTLIGPIPSTDEDRAADLADSIGQWMIGNLSALRSVSDLSALARAPT